MGEFGSIVAVVALAACSAAACSVLVLSTKRTCTEVEPVQVIELEPFGLDVHDAGAQ